LELFGGISFIYMGGNMKVILILFLFNLSSLYAAIPENDLRLPLTGNKLKSSFERPNELIRYQRVFDLFEETWREVLLNEYGKKIVFSVDLEDERVNASCSRDDDNNPILKIRGGLLRHPLMNEDVLNFILCHELGHFLGGAPKSFRGNTQKRSWSSVEGQADYFAVTKCLPRIYSNDLVSYDAQKSSLIKDKVKSICSGEVCSRIVYSGLLTTRFFASLKRGGDTPSIEKRERHLPSRTIQKHPSPQCRLDNVISAVKCEKDYMSLMDDLDISIGACVRKDIDMAGERAACWFNDSNY
jgi:hypothetical protein